MIELLHLLSMGELALTGLGFVIGDNSIPSITDTGLSAPNEIGEEDRLVGVDLKTAGEDDRLLGHGELSPELWSALEGNSCFE